MLGVGDHEIALVQLPNRSVQGGHLLALPRAPDDDAPPGELRPVESVERATERKHDVVRDVDDVRDRAHAGPDEPRLEPRRRGAEPRIAEGAADVTRAALEVLDRDVDLLVSRAR